MRLAQIILFLVSALVTAQSLGQVSNSPTTKSGQIDVRQYEHIIYSGNEIRDLYKAVGNNPVWNSKASIAHLVSAVESAGKEGLNHAAYHLDSLQMILRGQIEPACADVILSDAFITYANDLKTGSVDPSKLFPGDWDPVSRTYDVVIDLLQALSDENIAGALEALKPKDPIYCALKNELQLIDALPSSSIQCDSIEAYRWKLLVNMEKCRWISEPSSAEFIRVNIPTFELSLSGRDSCIMNMKAIVGRIERKTPVINSYITSLIINPEWTVPPTVLKEDMLPSIKKDKEYLKKNSLRLIDHDGLEIQPDSLPWSSYNGNNFPYIIKQDPGIRNALGLIKFHFANKHGIYMHDTNAHSLFSHTSRAFSSGCIRIEKPFALASHLLKDTGWDEVRLHELVDDGRTTSISLKNRVQIQTTYFTLIPGPGGKLLPANDIYDWDQAIANQLKHQVWNLSGNLNQDNK